MASQDHGDRRGTPEQVRRAKWASVEYAVVLCAGVDLDPLGEETHAVLEPSGGLVC